MFTKYWPYKLTKLLYFVAKKYLLQSSFRKLISFHDCYILVLFQIVSSAMLLKRQNKYFKHSRAGIARYAHGFKLLIQLKWKACWSHLFLQSFYDTNGHKTVCPSSLDNAITWGVFCHWGPVHTYPDIFEFATFSFRIRLPSTRIRRIWQRIRIFLNPLSRVEKINPQRIP